MSQWRKSDLLHLFANGAVRGEVSDATGVEIDTRRIKAGDIFLAFRGEQVDGHDFLQQAQDKGAVLALVEDFQDHALPQIRVSNMREALWQLARYARTCQGDTQFIAITGSVGKTSTRGLMRQALSVTHRVYASHGNFNNDLGMPLCLAQMGCVQSWDVAIFELGMSAAGEIAPLSLLLQPDIALVLNVRSVHQANFDSLTDIAHAKAEIFQGLSATGLAIAPNQAEFSTIFRDAVHDQAKLLVYNADDAPFIWQGEALLRRDKTKTPLLEAKDGRLRRFHDNILAIAQMYQARFGDAQQILATLVDWQPEAGRGKTSHGSIETGAEITLIDDSYNASLSSMLACLEDLHHREGGRKIVVLGEMKELGAQTAESHCALIDRLNSYPFAEVYVAGEALLALQSKIARLKFAANHAEELVEPLKSAIQTGDVIAFKGSQSVGLASVIKALNFK